jgi:hypothetical protein
MLVINFKELINILLRLFETKKNTSHKSNWLEWCVIRIKSIRSKDAFKID